MNLSKLSSKELFAHLAEIGDLLRTRKITRSSNNIVGDLAESLFCQSYKWKPADKSQRGFDAEDKRGKRYQIKGRRCIGKNKSHMLGAIRNLNDKDKPFDSLAVVIFSEDYEITYAALIEYALVEQKATKLQTHTNSRRFVLNQDCKETGVQDVTEKLRADATALLRTSKDFPDLPR
jgi:hypothetical protein